MSTRARKPEPRLAYRDTRTAGQRKADAHGPWSCNAPDRRRNRDFRAVRRIQWRPIGWYVAAMGVSMWLASPAARPLWMAIWGAK